MLLRRLGMLLRLLLLLLPVAALKVLAISQGWEVLRVTPLFAGLVTSNVFLIGFLFNGVLADYKESEKCPALLSLSLLNLDAELQSLSWAQPEADVTLLQRGLREVGGAFLEWFHGTVTTADLHERLDRLNRDLAGLRRWCEAPLMARLLQEVASLRGQLLRMETIRNVPFVPTVYLLSVLSTSFLCTGLALIRMKDLLEIVFYLGVIAFLMVFVLLMIWDLDNPFGHGDSFSCENVSLSSLDEAMARLNQPSTSGSGLDGSSTLRTDSA